MTAPVDRKGLLGFASLRPAARLAQDSRFPDAQAYRSFVDETRADPEAFWAELARELQWEHPPSGVGGPGDWFPGGRLNLTVTCLDAWVERELGGQEVIIALDANGRTVLSRDELLSRVGSLCERYRAYGLRPGHRLLIAMPRGYELLCLVLAGLRMGVTCVPLDPSSGDPGRIERRARAAGCTVALTARGVLDSGLAGQFDALPVVRREVLEPDWERDAFAPPAPEPLAPMHPAFVLADSSGRVFSLPTVGVALHGLSAYRHLLDGRGPGDLHWFQTPAHHASFLTGSLGALIAGGRIATPLAGLFAEPGRLLATFAQVRPRVAVIHARILERMVAECQRRSQAAPCGLGPDLLAIEGASVAPLFYQSVRHGLFDGNTHVIQVLGRPETSGLLAGPQPAVTPVRPASVGPAAPGLVLGVVDNQGRPCRDNHPGTLAALRIPPGLAIELQALRPPIPLGVRARMEPDGQIWSIGEAKLELPDGPRVASTEMEALIAGLPGVKAAAVVVVPDATVGGQVRVFVQSERGFQIAKQIRAALAERFGSHATPIAIQLVPGLPTSRTGKLLRSVLRRIAQGDTDGLDDLGLVTDPDLLAQLIRGRAGQEDESK